MRLFKDVQVPVEKGNSSKDGGSILKVFQSFIDKVKPEAAYFHLRDGKHAAVFLFEEADTAILRDTMRPSSRRWTQRYGLSRQLILRN